MSGMGAKSHYSIDKFRASFGPVVDVRSPSEYEQGHFPGAINLPLFNDAERHAVGITYKQEGRDSAIQVGLNYAGPKISTLAKELKKLSNQQTPKKSFTNSQDHLRIYCWRGGMRSSSIHWLAELLDLNPILLEGGYKSYRNWVLQQFKKEWPLKLLGGRTGTGKTDLLLELSKRGIGIVDLEGLANHRGSSFGGLGLPKQPTCEHYENLIAEALHNCCEISAKSIWIEAESSNLGRCRIPHPLFKQMQEASVLEILRSKDERIAQLVEVYGHHGSKSLEEATKRISRRLGPQRTREALDAIALEDWGKACKAMLDYYDRCYEHELTRVINRQKVDLTGLSNLEATEKLLKEGFVS